MVTTNISFYNEELNIRKVIESVRWADTLIVLDSFFNRKAYNEVEKTKKITELRIVIKPFFRFFKPCFVKLGFSDGKVGFVIARLNAYDVFTFSKNWRIIEDEVFKKNR